MCLSSKAGMKRRDATRGTFLVKHLSRGFLRVHSVSILWKLCLQCSLCAMFTACNSHCVWTPTQHFSPTAHPSHWPLSNCFVDNPPSSHCPLQSVSFVERMTSAQNHITLRCYTQQFLCLVLAMACLQSLRIDSTLFITKTLLSEHIKQNDGQRKYPDSQRGISSATDLTLPEPWIRNPVEVAERQHCLFGGLSAPVQDLLHLG